MHYAFLAYSVLLIGVIAANLLFNKLVRLEYTLYRSQWEQDGKPIGPLWWVPHESTTLGGRMIHPFSIFAMWRASLVWPFAPPEWARESSRGMHLIRWLRISLCLNLAAFIGLIACIAVL